MIDSKRFISDCEAIRRQSPLIHNISNYVAMNFSANALLAIGASPLMSFCPEEMVDIVAASGALSVNLGCLDSTLVKASKIAAASALRFGKPWVLDPVGAGVSSLRAKVATELAANYSPSVIRGNASEIIVLADSVAGVGGNGITPGVDRRPAVAGREAASEGEGVASGVDPRPVSGCGVDSTAAGIDAVEAGKRLSARTGAVVSISGATDYIIAGGEVATISNGSPMMQRVTAMGCTSTCITAAFLAVDTDPFPAAMNAMAMMGLAGEMAAAKSGGTADLALEFINELSLFNAEKAVINVISA